MTNQIRIMIDLETMSSQRDAAIISIGAVQFGKGISIEQSPQFYGRILPQSAEMFGHVDKATMEWWNKQDVEVMREAFGGVEHPGRVIDRFDEWVKGICLEHSVNIDQIELWSRGADFDLPILQHLYEGLRGEYPFNFRKHMCERTVRNLAPPEVLKIAESERPLGTAHNALEDAKNQAHYMNHVLGYLGVE